MATQPPPSILKERSHDSHAHAPSVEGSTSKPPQLPIGVIQPRHEPAPLVYQRGPASDMQIPDSPRQSGGHRPRQGPAPGPRFRPPYIGTGEPAWGARHVPSFRACREPPDAKLDEALPARQAQAECRCSVKGTRG